MCHFFGSCSRSKRYFDEILEGGDTHWSSWIKRTEDVRSSLAELLNANASELAFMPTASLGMNLIAQMLAKPGDRVFAAEKEFPSVTLPWLNQGAELSVLPLEEDGSVDLRKAEKRIDSNTIAFVASHVQYHTGYRYDLNALRRFCDNHGLRLIVDATQSVGVYPIDVERGHINAQVFSGYKWTTAGYGVGGLYIRQDLLDATPLPIVGWRSSKVAYDMAYDHLDVVREGRALEAGHPPFPGIFALGASLSLIREIGIARIAERVSDLTELLHKGLKARGYSIASPERPDARSGITLVPVSNATGVSERLMQRRVFISCFDGKLRVSLHFYNNENDIVIFLDHLQELEAPI